MTRVLLVGPGHDDFLVDGLLHGLRTLLGGDAVELPRADHLYGPPRADLHGLGFTFAGLFADDPADRHRALYRAVAGEFDLVIFADIWRSFGQWTQWGPQLRDAGVRLAVIDSSDRVEPFPFAGQFWRRRVWWLLPRVRGAVHFKREVTRWSGWFRSYLLLPAPLAPRLRVKPISFAIPAQLIADAPPRKTKDWPAHVVDAQVAARVGAQTAYAFDDPAAYHGDLRASRFGVTTKKAGWDALRHYEIAAAGAVPCFRDLDRKPPACAPYGLDATNCIAYRDADDLLARTAALGDAGYARLQEGALAWARANTTVELARRVLRECGVA